MILGPDEPITTETLERHLAREWCPACKQPILELKLYSVPTRIGDRGPCSHPGCMAHVTHPCEGCGRQWGLPAPADRPLAGEYVLVIVCQGCGLDGLVDLSFPPMGTGVGVEMAIRWRSVTGVCDGCEEVCEGCEHDGGSDD